ncbi:ATP-binding protein [Rhizohabitans arisaemae]|uniref:ATP-binding protein n=1 Tax=Rhizohabitans arisaemae TaxID=2720610 RepID=UPI0024B1C08D|nr:hypothetical protein [Rhizohabitans arisaemae]
MDTTAGSLPTELPRFIGRHEELHEIDRLLRIFRLVTLTGVAGVGKTRTALRAGDEATERFPDGVWLVPLSPLRDGALVPHAVGLAVKARDQTARPMIDLLVEHLAGRRCLLILDTCEHVVGECALLVTTLLRSCPDVRILATSRQPLRVGNEALVELAPLPAPPEEADPAGYDAVTLLVDRARRHVPGFALTSANADAVARLCRRLDGLPLALELAAAQLRDRTADELAGRPGPPAHGESTVLAPHGSLWTTIGWSHELCTPAERLLWARVSVFAAGFDLETAERVCGGGPVRDVPGTLASLVAKSVVVRGGGRYRLLDSLREYGAAWLGELGETQALLTRHRDHYLALARRAFPEWTGSGQVGWYHRFADEYPDVRLAMETCLAEPGSSALELAGCLWFFWFSCEYEREGRAYLERALDHDAAPGPLRVRAAWALGLVMIFQGDLEGIGRCIGECRSAASDPAATGAADYIEGTHRTMDGQPGIGLEQLASLTVRPWREGIQEAVWLLARAALVFAQVVTASYGDAAALAEDIRADGLRRGEQKFHSWGHYMKSLVHLAAEDHALAAVHARTAFEGSQQLNDSSNMALALEALAIAVTAQGDPEHAAVLLGTSGRLWTPSGGRDRFTAPEVAAARVECEQRILAAIGKESMESHYHKGLHSTWP